MFHVKKILRMGDQNSSGEVESDNPTAGVLFVLVVVLGIALIACGFAIRELVWITSKQIGQQDLADFDKKIVANKDAVKAELNKYEVVDDKKGIYQIPIDRAMEILVQRQSLEPISKGK